MRDEVEEGNDKGHRFYAKEFRFCSEDNGRVGSVRLEGVAMEEVTMKLLHCKEHSDNHVGGEG